MTEKERARLCLSIERVEQLGEGASFAFPLCGTITSLPAPQPGVEQVTESVSKHVEGVNNKRQAKPRPERQRLFIPYPWVQIGINQVDEEIEQDHSGGEKEVDSGDHRVVPVIEGIHQKTPEPRQVEDVLHDHGPPDPGSATADRRPLDQAVRI